MPVASVARHRVNEMLYLTELTALSRKWRLFRLFSSTKLSPKRNQAGTTGHARSVESRNSPEVLEPHP